MFADDLLSFAKGTIRPIQLVASRLTDFASILSLNISPTKSNVFFLEG